MSCQKDPTPGHTQSLLQPARTLPHDCGTPADSLCPLPLPVHTRSHLRGLIKVAACSRTRTNCVRCQCAGCLRLGIGRGHVQNSGKRQGCAAYLPGLFRGQNPLFQQGVTRAPSKTSRLQPCGCQRAASSTQADWTTFRMQFDTLTGHFPFWQCCHPRPKSRVSGTPKPTGCAAGCGV